MDDSTIELVGVQQAIRKRSTSYSVNNEFHTFQCCCADWELHHDCTMQCKSFHPDTCIIGHYWSHQTNSLNCSSLGYYSISVLSSESMQIDLDLSRTFPDNIYFSSKIGKTVLGRVLNRLSNYIPHIGYVQGMNYICAALLWHASEVDTFWIMVKLLEDYHLSENFSDGLPGLMRHCEKIEEFILKIWPKLSQHLAKFSIVPGMFMTDWCITIFTNVIPLDKICDFFSFFFEDGWDFFYKLALEIIDRLRKKIMKMDDRQDILTLIKPFQLYSDQEETFLKSISLRYEKKNWKKVLASATRRKLNN